MQLFFSYDWLLILYLYLNVLLTLTGLQLLTCLLLTVKKIWQKPPMHYFAQWIKIKTNSNYNFRHVCIFCHSNCHILCFFWKHFSADWKNIPARNVFSAFLGGPALCTVSFGGIVTLSVMSDKQVILWFSLQNAN